MCGQNIHVDATCPLPTAQCGDGTRVCNASTDCKDCWDGSNIPAVGLCPVQPSCGDGTLVTDPATECKSCCDGTNIPVGNLCPNLTYSCSDTSASYPNCCCSNMTPIVTQNACSVVWSCPAKPTVGLPPDANPGPNWTIVSTEYECFIQQTLVCTGSQGACFGPGNYCGSPTQIWYNNETGICTGPTDLLGNSCNTGYVCGESGLGP